MPTLPMSPDLLKFKFKCGEKEIQRKIFTVK